MNFYLWQYTGPKPGQDIASIGGEKVAVASVDHPASRRPSAST